jgi:hypothetical protein
MMFFSIPRNIPEFNTPAAFFGYLKRIMQNQISKAVRDQTQSQKRDCSREVSITEDLVSLDPGPVEIAEDSEYVDNWERFIWDIPVETILAFYSKLDLTQSIKNLAKEYGLSQHAMAYIFRRCGNGYRVHRELARGLLPHLQSRIEYCQAKKKPKETEEAGDSRPPPSDFASLPNIPAIL